MTGREIAIIAAAGAWWFWPTIGPFVTGAIERLPQAAPRTDPQPADPRDRRTNPQPQQRGDLDYRVIVGNINATWKDLIPTYRKPTLVLYDGQTSAGCSGRADSRMGPFYCPEDQKLYVPTSILEEVQQRGGCSGEPCRFVVASVVAHEIGHHVENLMGLMGRGPGGPQMELTADCLSGVWAKRENDRLKGGLVEVGDIEAALAWLNSIGSRSHGSGAQRQQAFNAGWRGGTLPACNTVWQGGA
jgi:uncharacterized protein